MAQGRNSFFAPSLTLSTPATIDAPDLSDSDSDDDPLAMQSDNEKKSEYLSKEQNNAEKSKKDERDRTLLEKRKKEKLREQYTKEYKINKLMDKIQPFLTYCEYNSIEEAKKDLLIEDKLRVFKSFSERIIKSDLNEKENDMMKTVYSWVGIKTNHEYARRAVQIILSANEATKNKPELEAKYVTNSLVSLSYLLQQLPKRSNYSIAGLFRNLHVAPAIQDIFNSFKYNQYEMCLMSPEMEKGWIEPEEGYLYVKPGADSFKYRAYGMKECVEIKKSEFGSKVEEKDGVVTIQTEDVSSLEKLKKLESKILDITSARKHTQTVYNTACHGEVYAKCARIQALLYKDTIVQSPRPSMNKKQ